MRFSAGVAAAAMLLMASAANAETTVERVTDPVIGELSSREVGESMVDISLRTTSPGLLIQPGTEMAIPLSAGVLRFLGDGYPARAFGKKTKYCGTVQVRPKLAQAGPPGELCFTPEELTKRAVPFEIGNVTRQDPANFRQQLLYQGKSGNALRISYREFSGDLSRPAFTQELTFDLGEGAVIGIKGARVEVVEATNTMITYRLLQPFKPVLQ